MVQKQMAYMLGRQQIFLELEEDVEDADELVELMSNSHLNNNFLALAREVCSLYPLVICNCFVFCQAYTSGRI